MKKIVLVNQTANYLFADIIKAFASKFPETEIEAWYGSFDYDTDRLPSAVKLQQGPQYDRQSFSKRFRSWLRFYFWMRKKMRKVDKKNTYFFFVSNPPLFVFLPNIKSLNFDCLIYDLYPDVLGNMRKKQLINSIAKRWGKKNKQVLPLAQHIYTIGEGLKDAIRGYLPASAEHKVQLVPVWPAETDEVISPKRNFRAEWRLEDKKIILYSGNMGLTHPLEYIIELAQKMQGYKDWSFVIVGKGAKKTLLEQQASALGNVLFKDPVPFEDLPALLSIADWGYVTLDTSATNTSVPSKTYNLLAKGVPILAMVNEQSEIAKLIDSYKVGLYFKEQEIENVVQRIVTMDKDSRAVLAANAAACSSYFTSALADTFANNSKASDV